MLALKGKPALYQHVRASNADSAHYCYTLRDGAFFPFKTSIPQDYFTYRIAYVKNSSRKTE